MSTEKLQSISVIAIDHKLIIQSHFHSEMNIYQKNLQLQCRQRMLCLK